MENQPQMVIKRKEQEVKLFLQDLGQLFRGEQFCDVRIRCSDGDLACQSVLLSAVSPFLRHIFSTRSIIEEESHLLLIVPNTRCFEVEIFLSGLLGLNGQSNSDICDSPEFKNVSETFEAFIPLKPQFKEPLGVSREKLKATSGDVFPTENWCQVSIKSENGEHETNLIQKTLTNYLMRIMMMMVPQRKMMRRVKLKQISILIPKRNLWSQKILLSCLESIKENQAVLKRGKSVKRLLMMRRT